MARIYDTDNLLCNLYPFCIHWIIMSGMDGGMEGWRREVGNKSVPMGMGKMFILFSGYV